MSLFRLGGLDTKQFQGFTGAAINISEVLGIDEELKKAKQRHDAYKDPAAVLKAMEAFWVKQKKTVDDMYTKLVTGAAKDDDLEPYGVTATEFDSMTAAEKRDLAALISTTQLGFAKKYMESMYGGEYKKNADKFIVAAKAGGAGAPWIVKGVKIEPKKEEAPIKKEPEDDVDDDLFE